jgi:hypothetical protein
MGRRDREKAGKPIPMILSVSRRLPSVIAPAPPAPIAAALNSSPQNADLLLRPVPITATSPAWIAEM